MPQATPSSGELDRLVRGRAAELGFTRVGVCAADSPAGIDHYDRFLDAGHHADMEWMRRGRDARAQPSTLLQGLRSVVMLGIDYGWPRPPRPPGLYGRVARYAWGRDYHNLVSKRLRKLCRDLRAQDVDCWWFVDSRPVIERAWADQAGLGFSGRNCCTIAPGDSSWFFLAGVLVAAELVPDRPLAGGMARHCGRCRRCHDACPTHAFVGDGQLDARRCLSWMTIEAQGGIPLEWREQLGDWVFGCDLCQEVCPHNHREPSSLERDFAPRPGHAWLDLEWVIEAEDGALEAALTGSPLRRPGAIGLKRNACVVLGNLGDTSARPLLERAARHSSPTVQEHARWGLERLG
jgi:epoxyqueuosine reductase